MTVRVQSNRTMAWGSWVMIQASIDRAKMVGGARRGAVGEGYEHTVGLPYSQVTRCRCYVRLYLSSGPVEMLFYHVLKRGQEPISRLLLATFDPRFSSRSD